MFRISFKPSFEFLFSVSMGVSAIVAFAFLATVVAIFFHGTIFHDWTKSFLTAVVLLISIYGFFLIRDYRRDRQERRYASKVVAS